MSDNNEEKKETENERKKYFFLKRKYLLVSGRCVRSDAWGFCLQTFVKEKNKKSDNYLE